MDFPKSQLGATLLDFHKTEVPIYCSLVILHRVSVLKQETAHQIRSLFPPLQLSFRSIILRRFPGHCRFEISLGISKLVDIPTVT